jgi:hypothetical protein
MGMINAVGMVKAGRNLKANRLLKVNLSITQEHGANTLVHMGGKGTGNVLYESRSSRGNFFLYSS